MYIDSIQTENIDEYNYYMYVYAYQHLLVNDFPLEL